jgi:hypothetical protein
MKAEGRKAGSAGKSRTQERLCLDCTGFGAIGKKLSIAK